MQRRERVASQFTTVYKGWKKSIFPIGKKFTVSPHLSLLAHRLSTARLRPATAKVCTTLPWCYRHRMGNCVHVFPSIKCQKLNDISIFEGQGPIMFSIYLDVLQRYPSQRSAPFTTPHLPFRVIDMDATKKLAHFPRISRVTEIRRLLRTLVPIFLRVDPELPHILFCF